jgi:threonyl-tRNA synthetase
MAAIKLPDNSVKEIPDGSTVGQLAAAIGPGLAKAAIVGKVDGKLVDLSYPLVGDHAVSIITSKDADGLFVMRHSTAHVLAQALRRLYGTTLQYTIGPVIDNGFFYDFEFPKDSKFSAEDLPKVEAEMAKIVAEKLPFSREEVALPAAKELLHSQSQRFKDEIIDELGESGEKSVSIYRQGEFTDLCRGPHVPDTGRIKAFKLLSVAGAYWRGDSKREQLTRIYGTAFFDDKQLAEHVNRLDEAKKRDHRVLGPQLGLFTIDEQVGQGLVLWKPKGAAVRLELQKFISEHLRRQGYKQVFTPHIGRLDLYKTSGHYPYYRESQFPPLIDREYFEALAKESCGCAELANRMEKGEIDGYLLKPMNCPHHIRIYASDPHSYRDLPVRLAEFGTVYRWEKSGELGGMTRVRGFTQDARISSAPKNKCPPRFAVVWSW